MRRLFAPLLFLCAVSAQAQHPPANLSELVDAAWQREPRARLLDARRAELAALAEVAAGSLPGPGTVGLSHRNDRLQSDRGRLEWELEYAQPLWLPGQAAARRQEADVALRALEAERVGESPEDYVQRVTFAKWEAACARLVRRRAAVGHDWAEAPILCADTTVALGAQILGKPADAEEAQRMLAQLAGQTHHVFTAVAVQCAAQRWAALSVSQVTFAPLTPAQIAAYVASGEPMGKAGAYAIQGPAQQYVRHLAGSYSGIMGLPLYETAALLRQVGWPG